MSFALTSLLQRAVPCKKLPCTHKKKCMRTPAHGLDAARLREGFERSAYDRDGEL